MPSHCNELSKSISPLLILYREIKERKNGPAVLTILMTQFGQKEEFIQKQVHLYTQQLPLSEKKISYYSDIFLTKI